MTEYRENSESDATPQITREESADAGGLTELSIRVSSIDPELVSWSSGCAVICLMADLLTASGGQLVPESRQTLIAQFDRQETAVGAARRLQRALQVFAESPETAGFAASIAIRRPEDLLPGTAVSASNSLWSHFAPGEILVSGTVFETLQFTPGLEFRSLLIDPLIPDAGYHELLWTDAETLAVLQERVDNASRSLQMEGSRRRPEMSDADDEPVKASAPGELAAVGREDEFLIATDASRGNKRFWFATAVLCLALVAVVGAVMHLDGRKAHDFHQEPPKSQTLEPQAIPHADLPIPGNVLEKQQETAAEETPSKPPHSRVTPNGRKTAHETVLPVTDYEGFTNKQIPQLLHRAEEDAGAGNYDNAKREYEIVLKLQPGNSTAREGLRKLDMKVGGRQ